MRQIIAILLLSVLVIALSGCDKIKAELERRHLGDQTKKELNQDTPQPTPQVQKTSDDALIADQTSSKRKQIVFRIDLPSDEKIQIRLIKNPEDVESVSPVQSESSLTESKSKAEIETQETKEKKQENKSEKPESSVEEQTMGAIETHLVEQRRKAEEQQASDERPQPEMDMDRQERSPAIEPASAPTIVVPSSELASPPKPFERKDNQPRLDTTEMAPAEKAVGAALSLTPPETKMPASREKSNGTLTPEKTTSVNPWAIPNADYPLQYY